MGYPNWVSHIFYVSRTRTAGESPGSDPTAAGGGVKGGERVAAVDKIEDQRKPEDFVGHRNRTPGTI
jgi:hypothetical protein